MWLEQQIKTVKMTNGWRVFVDLTWGPWLPLLIFACFFWAISLYLQTYREISTILRQEPLTIERSLTESGSKSEGTSLRKTSIPKATIDVSPR